MIPGLSNLKSYVEAYVKKTVLFQEDNSGRIPTVTSSKTSDGEGLSARNICWGLQGGSSATTVKANMLFLKYIHATPWTAAHQASLSITNSWSLPKLMSIESVMPSKHHILCCPFSSCLQSFPTSASFLMSQFFTSGGQSIGVSASVPVFPKNIQD